MSDTVSTIITSYNYARFIGAAIQSVLDQTQPVSEIIVVDDGSTDATPEVLSHFGTKITCLYQQHAGKSSALNRGIAAATGQYLAFLDSDDCWLPDAVERRLALFANQPSVGAVYGRTRVIDAEGRYLPYCKGAPERYPGDPIRSLLHGMYIPFLTFMVRRTCLERAGAFFDPAYGPTNDVELLLRLARVCRFAYIDIPLACYRMHSANWSRNAVAMGAEMARLVHTTLAAPDLPPAVRRSEPTILRNLYTNIGLEYHAAGMPYQSLHYFARALALSSHPLWAALRALYLGGSGPALRHPLSAPLIEGVARLKRRANSVVARTVQP